MGRENLRIVNQSRGTLLGADVSLADSWFRRLQGYLGRPEPRRGEGILLAPCNAIHTYGMSFSVDVIFLSADGRVVKAMAEVAPGRRSERVAGGRYVLELPAGTIASTGTSVGDDISWAPARARAHVGNGAGRG